METYLLRNLIVILVLDKILRISMAIAIAVMYFLNVISGTIAIVAGIVAIIFVATSFMSFCPLYFPFGINTAGKKK
jgi:hypothetical protein